jgi:hypothetical protein
VCVQCVNECDGCGVSGGPLQLRRRVRVLTVRSGLRVRHRIDVSDASDRDMWAGSLRSGGHDDLRDVLCRVRVSCVGYIRTYGCDMRRWPLLPRGLIIMLDLQRRVRVSVACIAVSNERDVFPRAVLGWRCIRVFQLLGGIPLRCGGHVADVTRVHRRHVLGRRVGGVHCMPWRLLVPSGGDVGRHVGALRRGQLFSRRRFVVQSVQRGVHVS